MQSNESRNKICETRRGGGMPFFVQAIVSTELVENGRKSLDKSMKVLLALAEQNFQNDQENFSKVVNHSIHLLFNKLFKIFK